MTTREQLQRLQKETQVAAYKLQRVLRRFDDDHNPRRAAIELHVGTLAREGYDLDFEEEVERLCKLSDAEINDEIARMRRYYKKKPMHLFPALTTVQKEGDKTPDGANIFGSSAVRFAKDNSIDVRSSNKRGLVDFISRFAKESS